MRNKLYIFGTSVSMAFGFIFHYIRTTDILESCITLLLTCTIWFVLFSIQELLFYSQEL